MSVTLPLVSVIVPTRNSASTLGVCLESINAQTYPAVELIVVDRDSSDETPAIARSKGALVLTAGPERSAQRNVGARSARGDAVMFVDSDMVLEPGVIEACVAASKGGAGVIIPERGFDDRFFTRVRAFEKQCYEGNDAVEAARFFPRAALIGLGGYDERLVAGEDWDLMDRWRLTGRPVARVAAVILHDDRHLTLISLIRKRFFYGRQFVAYTRKNGRAAAARHLGPGRFLAAVPALARSPIMGAALLAIKAMEAVSFGAGMLAGAVATRNAAS